MIRYLVALAITLVISAGLAPAQAQAQAPGTSYVQIEAQPTLDEAQQSIRRYSDYLRDVNGFQLGSGYYAVALGPYPDSDEAIRVLRSLRSQGAIPGDSYVTFPSTFTRQFWPVGAQQDVDVQTLPDASDDSPFAEGGEETFEQMMPDETPAEARRSEQQLTRAQRDQLQVALQWAGFYNGSIDGAFGRGTRNSMAAWQSAHGYEASGILTTQQRQELLGQYNAVLEGLDLQPHTDQRAGIEMDMPMGVVEFDRYEAPFALYEPSTDLPARVVLISQEGDRATLSGLYEIMQTLAIVPQDGPRTLSRDSFTIEGRNSRIVSYTQAGLENGRIKGFTLVWPTGDEARRTRLLETMQASFTRLPGVLPDGAGVDSDQHVDLVSGLRVRKPELSRSGVFVNDAGAVLTVAEAVENCGSVTLAGDYAADVVGIDRTTGLALLRPQERLSPRAVARLATSTPRIASEVAVAGYSYEGLLSAPSLTYGTLADVRGLNGEEGVDRLEVSTLPGDAGGPVFDSTGAVIGLLQSAPSGDRQLPDGVAFAVDGMRLAELLSSAGIAAKAGSETTGALSPEKLARQAGDMTVLVSCWN